MDVARKIGVRLELMIAPAVVVAEVIGPSGLIRQAIGRSVEFIRPRHREGRRSGGRAHRVPARRSAATDDQDGTEGRNDWQSMVGCNLHRDQPFSAQTWT